MMKLEAIPEYASLSKGGTRPNELHLLARMDFTGGAGTVSRPPMHMALVLDASGSMQGDKIRLTQQCAVRFMQWLTRRDYLTVIAYNSSVSTLIAHTALTDKAYAAQRIMNLTATGGTNLSGGWLRGLAELREHRHPQHLYRLLLLTDGQANEGMTEPAKLKELAAQTLAQGIATTTLGFGEGFNEGLLREIAAGGGGRFHYVSEQEGLSKAFQEEFGVLVTLVAQNVEVCFQPAKGVSVTRALTTIPVEKDDRKATVRLGDASAGDSKVLLLSLRLPSKLTRKKAVALGRLSAKCDLLAGSLMPAQKMLRVSVPVIEGTQGDPNAEVRREAWLAQGATLKLQAAEKTNQGDFLAGANLLRRHSDEGEALAQGSAAHEVREEIRQLRSLAQEIDSVPVDLTADVDRQRQLSKVLSANAMQQCQRTGSYRKTVGQRQIKTELKPSRPEEAEDVIGEVLRAAAEADFSDERVDRLRQVLRELLDNAFNHGSRNRPDGIVQADCLVTDNYARCVVYDNGPGFDYPAQLKREEEGHLKAGTRGRGLLLVARAVDRIEVDTSKGSRFEVVLYKQSVDVAVRRKIPERGSSEISDSSVSTVNPLPRGIVVVTVNGYLDSHSFEEVEETINDLFRKHFYKVVVDLSHVEYISSSGAGVFIGALSEAQEHDGNIVLVNPTNSVSEVLDLLGLRQIFNVCRSVEEAQEFFT